MIANRYILSEKIGQGSFGVIFKAQHRLTMEWVAIKMEDEVKLLRHEASIYKYLGKHEGLPSLLWYGQSGKYRYMVLPFYKCTIGELKYKISENEIFRMGKLLVDILQYIHEKRLLHRDINPNNIMLDDTNHVHIIDFGFAKTFVTEDDKHISNTHKDSIIGTPNFVSLHVHDGNEPSRRDDCESILYVMLYVMGNSSLEQIWNQPDKNRIRAAKRYCKTDPTLDSSLVHLFHYFHTLEFEKRPDYTMISELLEKKGI